MEHLLVFIIIALSIILARGINSLPGDVGYLVWLVGTFTGVLISLVWALFDK